LNNKLHILFLCGWYPSRVLPNNGDFIQRHAKAVSSLNKISVLHIISDENCIKEIEIVSEVLDGIQTHIGYVKKTNNPILKIYLYYKAFKLMLLKIGLIDVIHLNTLYPFGLLALHQKIIKKIPFIISEHWTGYHQPQASTLSFWRKLISKIIVRKAAFVCPVSNDLKNSLEQISYKGNYKPIPNVVDTSIFNPEKIENSVFTIIHASNLVNEHKNIEGILQVIAKLQEKINPFVFKLIGKDAHKYETLAKELKINSNSIIFKNHISHQEVAKELNKSNLFILFSNYENLPCVILEAFSTGTPVISTDVGGIREYFPEDFGYLINKGNQEELLDNIIKIQNNFIVNKQKMHSYVKQHFSEKVIALEFNKLYKFSLK